MRRRKEQILDFHTGKKHKFPENQLFNDLNIWQVDQDIRSASQLIPTEISLSKRKGF